MSVRPRVEISTYLRVGPDGTTVSFSDLKECDAGALRPGDEVVVSSHAMNLGGYARVRKILVKEQRLLLDINWGDLQPLRRS